MSSEMEAEKEGLTLEGPYKEERKESTESTKLLIRPKGVQQFYSVLVYYRSLVLA